MTHTDTRTDPDVHTESLREADAELKRFVVAELAWTPSIDPTHIGVAVNGGAVSLSGEVDSYPEKMHAEMAVQRVKGVHAVAQEITVRGTSAGMDNIDVARAAGEAIAMAVDVPADAVRVSVHNHVVTLTGSVAWNYQREAAARSVHFLRGVRDVRNLILVKPAVSTDMIKRAISTALVRNAIVAGEHCTVSADALGAVVLEGTVESWSERRQAEQVAWSAPGVTAVHNKLRVQN